MTRDLLLAVGALVVVVSQAAAAPLFSLAAAAPAVALLFIGLVALYRGETTAMVLVPAMAIAEAWTRGVAPGLLLVGYAPLVPLLAVFDPRAIPLAGPGTRLVAALAVTGAWARLVASGSVFLAGATFLPGQVVGRLLLPGLMLDFVLAVTVYTVARLALGEPGRRPLVWR